MEMCLSFGKCVLGTLEERVFFIIIELLEVDRELMGYY